MDASNVIAAVSAAIAALGLGLAGLQFFGARQHARGERERLAQQQERLRTAVSTALLGTESADLIVQRAKDKDVTVAELQSIARVLRGSLTILARQLDDERRNVADASESRAFRSVAQAGDSAAVAAYEVREEPAPDPVESPSSPA